MVAQVQPSWIESAAAHLVRRTYGDAHWVAERGMVLARETVSLYGRVLSRGREVNFANIDAGTARRIFVEEALVRRSGMPRAAFLDRNDALRHEIERIEAKLRRRDLLAGEDRIVDFYLERIPADIAGTRAFERWWRQEEHLHPHRLDMPRELLLAEPRPSAANQKPMMDSHQALVAEVAHLQSRVNDLMRRVAMLEAHKAILDAKEKPLDPTIPIWQR